MDNDIDYDKLNLVGQIITYEEDKNDFSTPPVSIFLEIYQHRDTEKYYERFLTANKFHIPFDLDLNYDSGAKSCHSLCGPKKLVEILTSREEISFHYPKEQVDINLKQEFKEKLANEKLKDLI